jgi:hypothetical protein
LDQIILTYPYINRLEGKAANLEAENQVLRQQATATPPSTAKSPASRSKITRIHVNVSLKDLLSVYFPSHSTLKTVTTAVFTEKSREWTYFEW